MPSLFERPYRAAAATELERSLREIEDRNKKAQTKDTFHEAASNMTSNVNFAEKLNLITAQQAEAYRERIKKAAAEYERMQRTESQEGRVDDFENPRERTDRYMSMEEAQAEIARERAAQNAQQAQSQQTQSAPTHIKDEDDGSRTH